MVNQNKLLRKDHNRRDRRRRVGNENTRNRNTLSTYRNPNADALTSPDWIANVTSLMRFLWIRIPQKMFDIHCYSFECDGVSCLPKFCTHNICIKKKINVSQILFCFDGKHSLCMKSINIKVLASGVFLKGHFFCRLLSLPLSSFELFFFFNL